MTLDEYMEFFKRQLRSVKDEDEKAAQFCKSEVRELVQHIEDLRAAASHRSQLVGTVEELQRRVTDQATTITDLHRAMDGRMDEVDVLREQLEEAETSERAAWTTAKILARTITQGEL